MKRQLAIGIVFSAGFLYLALRGIEWSEFGAVFRTTNIWWVLLGALCTMLGHYVRAYRWSIMLAPIRPVTTWSSFSATCVGLAFNNLLPARLGEIVRAMAIGRTEQISKSAAFATIVYERVVDVFGLLVLLWLALLRVPGAAWLQRSGLIILLMNVVLLVLLWVMVRYEERFMAVMRRLIRPLPDRFRDRAESWTGAFVEGLHVVRSGRAVFHMIWTSIGVWGFAGLGIYCCLIGMDIDVPPMTSVVLLVLIPLGTMIPSAPAYVGPVQYACVLGLGLYGVGNSEALAYSMVFHAHHFFPVTLAGLYFAWRSQISVSDATAARDARGDASPA